MAAYYRRFIGDYTLLTKHLHKLITKQAPKNHMDERNTKHYSRDQEQINKCRHYGTSRRYQTLNFVH